MQTIIKEYVAATDEAVARCNKVRVTTGFIRSNDFIGRNDNEIHTRVKYSSNFINRVTDDSFEPKSVFS